MNPLIYQTCGVIWLIWWTGWIVVGFTARKNVTRESFVSRLPHLIPLVAGISLVWWPTVRYPMEWDAGLQWYPIPGILCGLGFAVWARWHLGRYWSGLVALKDDHQLVTSGPYRVTRHPIYTGLLFAMLMTALAINSYLALAGVACWFVAFYIKAAHEEKLLEQLNKREYMDHCEAVYDRLIPGVV